MEHSRLTPHLLVLNLDYDGSEKSEDDDPVDFTEQDYADYFLSNQEENKIKANFLGYQ